MSAAFDPIAIASLVTGRLEAIGVRCTIGGSIASSFAGEPRSTLDIDVVAALGEAQIPALVQAISPEFYVDGDALKRAVREHSSTNLIHQDSQVKVDLFIAGGTPLDEQQLARRRTVNLGSGQVIHVHPPEDILLQKLSWYQKGGGVSDRQWRDILGIVRVQADRLDRTYLTANAPRLSVAALLERAMREGGSS